MGGRSSKEKRYSSTIRPHQLRLRTAAPAHFANHQANREGEPEIGVASYALSPRDSGAPDRPALSHPAGELVHVEIVASGADLAASDLEGSHDRRMNEAMVLAMASLPVTGASGILW